MRWLPRWSLADRQRWAESHPWVVGFDFGVIMGIAFGIYVTIPKRVGIGVIVGVAVWLVCWPLFAIALKRRWFQRPGAEDVNLASFIRRPWSRLSDRILWWYMGLFAFSALVSVFGLVTRPVRVSAAFTLSVSLVILATTWAERKRRRSSP